MAAQVKLQEMQNLLESERQALRKATDLRDNIHLAMKHVTHPHMMPCSTLRNAAPCSTMQHFIMMM